MKDKKRITFPWDDFINFHCNTRFLDRMLKENVIFSFGEAVNPVDLGSALMEMEDNEHQIKLLELMEISGFSISDEYIAEAYEVLGDSYVVSEMIRKCQGAISPGTIKNFVECGMDEDSLRLAFAQCKDMANIEFDTMVELANTTDFEDDYICDILKRSQAKPDSFEQIEDFLGGVNDAEMFYRVFKPYIDVLPFAQRVQLRDDFGIDD